MEGWKVAIATMKLLQRVSNYESKYIDPDKLRGPT